MALRDGDCVGHAQVTSLDPSAGVARLGRIIIAPSHRGHRLAIPMLRLVLNEAFAVGGIERVDLSVYTWNAGAIKTYTRLGFKPGAINRASVCVGGDHWDAQEMSLSREARP
jgi:RimJ/RimL family protein N-acetyltransferase